MESKVSVVIPTYRRTGETIKNAIQSVLDQTYNNLEIIVVDDNGVNNEEYSKDIIKVLEKLPGVVYIAHKENKGACEARNSGIKHSTGEFIAFLDDDDKWEKTKIELQIKKFRNPNVGLVYCGIKYYFEENNKEVYQTARKSANPCRDLLIQNYIGSTSCGIVRKTCAIEVGMFDSNLKSGQDLDFWYRLASKFEVDCVEECLLHYTVYSQETITSNVKNRLLSNVYLRNKYSEAINKDIELKTVYTLKITKALFLNKKYLKGFWFIIAAIFKRELSLTALKKYAS